MDLKFKGGKSGWTRNEELIYSFLCMGIAASLIFWPLLNSLFSIALFAYWLVFTRKTVSFRSANGRWLLLFGSLYLIVIIGALYSSNKADASFSLQQKSAILLFPLVFSTSQVLTPLVVERSFKALAWSTALGCLYCLARGLYIYARTGSTANLQGYNLIALKDMLPFVLGLCCLLSIIYLINRMYDAIKAGRALRSVWSEVAVALFLSGFIFLLGNRSILVCLTVVVVFYSVRVFKRMIYRLAAIGILGAILALAVIVNPFLKYQWNDLIDFSESNEIPLDKDESLGRSWGGKAIRLTIWKCSLDVIEENLLAGVGTGDVQQALQKAYEERKFYFASRYNTYNAHNQYLQETLAHGLIGFFIFGSCIFVPISVYLKRRRDSGYVLFLLCFAIVCLTESLLELNKGIIWYSFFNAVFIFKKE